MVFIFIPCDYFHQFFSFSLPFFIRLECRFGAFLGGGGNDYNCFIFLYFYFCPSLQQLSWKVSSVRVMGGKVSISD